ncbi:MAG TPA: cysteine rich repeat-containing protein [Myxococcaceae bacterium]|nr:cysteine rich repeat-containing protein [Myxococcaceae bacterium]
MRKTIGTLVAATVLTITGQARAADSLEDSVKKACNKELTTFCKGVPQGEGRILACLYAFEDKVSDKCIYALYDASSQLKDAIAALDFAATQCKGDLQKFCADVQPGQGRGLACIQKNQKSATQACQDALKQTGLWKK